jgi:thiol-disulfide isomerase/thioredoxin
MRSLLLLAPLAAGLFAQTPTPSLDGLWSATVTVNNREIPFRIGFSTEGGVHGWFFNGDERVASTSGTFENGALLLRFDHYATRLEAQLANGELTGTYGREGRVYSFHAAAYRAPAVSTEVAPNIAGLWDVEVESSKGEKAWRLIVDQKAGEVSAAILRVDGDTGLLTGEYRAGQFTLSHFSGARPSLMTLALQSDGSLEVVQNGKKLTAVRSAEARDKGLPAPDDPMQHTTVKDPSEPLRFAFPDLDGRVVSNTDARFQGKVLLVAIGGSWCPNCHDEAPYLEELYRKYRAAGLEVVDLSFEEADQLKDPTRLRAFIKEYGIEYPVLLPGEPSDLNAKIPQAVNLNAWPTTFFVGRDGRVRAIHTGFAGKASGELHDQMTREIEGTLRQLLAEDAAALLANGEPRQE